MNVDLLQKQLLHEEGLRLKPYRDSVGKLTIGVGRNLDDRGLTTDEAMYLLKNDIQLVVNELDFRLPWWATLDDVRQRVLADMAFNMGVGGLVGFHNTLSAIERGDFAAAASGMLASKWHGDVGSRAVALADMMRTGQDPA